MGKSKELRFKRVIWVVLDGVGAGEMPDASQFGDGGSDTLGNLSRVFKKQTGRSLHLPHLEELGLGNITPMEGVAPLQAGSGKELTEKQQSCLSEKTRLPVIGK